MSNRKRILKFCKERGLEVVSLEYVRSRDCTYGDWWDSSCWNLTVKIDGEDRLYAPEEGNVELSIHRMFKEIEEDTEPEATTEPSRIIS